MSITSRVVFALYTVLVIERVCACFMPDANLIFFVMERLEMFLGKMEPKAEVDVHKKIFHLKLIN